MGSLENFCALEIVKLRECRFITESSTCTNRPSVNDYNSYLRNPLEDAAVAFGLKAVLPAVENAHKRPCDCETRPEDNVSENAVLEKGASHNEPQGDLKQGEESEVWSEHAEHGE